MFLLCFADNCGFDMPTGMHIVLFILLSLKKYPFFGKMSHLNNDLLEWTILFFGGLCRVGWQLFAASFLFEKLMLKHVLFYLIILLILLAV